VALTERRKAMPILMPSIVPIVTSLLIVAVLMALVALVLSREGAKARSLGMVGLGTVGVLGLMITLISSWFEPGRFVAHLYLIASALAFGVMALAEALRPRP
jgi:multisubunit Na+/H+ antiporter MnhB subunit